MKIPATRRNLLLHSKDLLGNEWDEDTEKKLIKVCRRRLVRTHGHISHDQAAHLEEINEILHTCGVEGFVLDEDGNDLSSTGSDKNVYLDVQYCNAGDTYALTIMYVNGRLCIGDWGTLMGELTQKW